VFAIVRKGDFCLFVCSFESPKSFLLFYLLLCIAECVIDDRYIHVIGGADLARPQHKAILHYVFDTQTNRWAVPTTTGQVPPPLISHTCVAHANDGHKWIAVMGGVITSGKAGEASSAVYILDIGKLMCFCLFV
jgi:hypothetical protein